MSSLAQEESRSISENVTWGQRKRFSDGKVSMPYKNFLGYERGENGVPKIVESEAKIVRMIYRLFLEGLTPTHIAKRLTEAGIPTPAKKQKWQASTVDSILTNEKYKGDALLQKKFTVDFLTKKQKTNEGEIPQYYVEGSHEGIVSPEVFDLVQYELQRRKELGKGYYNSTSIFSSRLFCGQCGGRYGSKVWHSNQKYRKEVYRCNHKYGEITGEATGCTTPVLTEDEIKSAFLDAFNRCINNRNEIIENCDQAIAAILDAGKLELEASAKEEECTVAAELIRKCVEAQAHAVTPSEDYEERYEALVARYTAAKNSLESIEEEIAQRNYRMSQIRFFLDSLRQQKNLVTTFDPIIWNTVIDKVTIYSKKRIVFKFKGGMEITQGVV